MTGGRSVFSRTILYEYKGRKERRVHMSSRSALVAVVIELDSAKAMAVRSGTAGRQEAVMRLNAFAMNPIGTW